MRTFHEYLDQRYAIDRPIAKSTLWDYHWTVNVFENWFGRTLEFGDLTEPLLSEFLRDLEGKRAPKTLKSHRATMLVVWRAIATDGHCPMPEERRVRKVKVPRKNPVAWTGDELTRLLDAVRKLPGKMARIGVPRAIFFEALVRVTYETGLRRNDVFNIELSSIREDGTFAVLMGKTNVAHVCKLTPTTLALLREVAAMNKINPDKPLWVRGNMSGCFYRWWRMARSLAGLKGDGGAMQKLRRTGATHLEKVKPGGAMAFLGHLTYGLAYASYVDRTIAFEPQLPPTITPPPDVSAIVENATTQERDRKLDRSNREAMKLFDAIRSKPAGDTLRRLRIEAGLDCNAMKRASWVLLEGGIIEPAKIPMRGKLSDGYRIREGVMGPEPLDAPVVLDETTGACQFVIAQF